VALSLVLVPFGIVASVPAFTAGKAFTVTLNIAALAASHPFAFVYLTLTVLGPVVVQVIVTVLSVLPPPDIIEPPAEIVQT
jgi:hypothetical protein